MAILEDSPFATARGLIMEWANLILSTLFAETATAGIAFAVSLIVMIALLVHWTALSHGTRRRFLERLLIIGTGPLAQRLVLEIEARPRWRYLVAGIVDDGTASDKASFPCPLLGPLERLEHIIKEIHPDRIIIAVAQRRGRLPVEELLDSRVDGILVENAVEAYERLTGKLAIEALTPSNLVFSENFRKSRATLAFGRGISLLASVIGLVGLAPLFGLIALAIKLESHGPVFFVQKRVGQYGTNFDLIKFRTMRPTGRNLSEWAQDNGDRITRVGKWLRKFRFDELPQFVNILRGEMNLVGPRPHPASNLDLLAVVSRNAPECGLAIPYYSLRSLVPPGITGWAQVRYQYANTLEEEIEKLRYDLYYIKHRSVWLDLRILFETVGIVLMGHGTGADASACAATPPLARKPEKFAKTA
jgi:exopolysaccharide biosynthesis polyprenyl glycosylphosphotransferase